MLGTTEEKVTLFLIEEEKAIDRKRTGKERSKRKSMESLLGLRKRIERRLDTQESQNQKIDETERLSTFWPVN